MGSCTVMLGDTVGAGSQLSPCKDMLADQKVLVLVSDLELEQKYDRARLLVMFR